VRPQCRRVVALAGVVAFAAGCAAPSGHDWILVASSDGARSGHDDGKHFAIAGSVGGLYPGADGALELQITNPNPFAIVVHSVSVQVRDATAGCSARELTIPGFRGAVNVPAHGKTPIVLPVTMDHSAADSCQGARFPLTYNATASKA
jgi:hypothetical protein